MTDTRDELEDAHAQAVRVLEIEMSGLVARFRQTVREAADRLSPGLHPGAYKTFVTIAQREPVTPSALAEHLVVDKGLLSRTVRLLEDLGLVERRPDPDDGRSSLLSLTPDGRERLTRARASHPSSLMERLSHWDVADVRQLAVLLHALGNGEAPGDFAALESLRHDELEGARRASR
jgi:DNA-binding MarR family transcriptional regulator